MDPPEPMTTQVLRWLRSTRPSGRRYAGPPVKATLYSRPLARDLLTYGLSEHSANTRPPRRAAIFSYDHRYSISIVRGVHLVQRVRTILISDLTDKECTNGGETVDFAYRGVSYSIDLTSKEAQKFDDVMFPYTDSARRLGKQRGSRRPTTESTVDARAVRAWAGPG